MLALHELYGGAGKPTVRVVSGWMKGRDDLPGTMSPDIVSKVLRGSSVRWPNLEAFVQVLVEQQIGTKVRLAAARKKIHKLWVLAESAPLPSPPAADPEPESEQVAEQEAIGEAYGFDRSPSGRGIAQAVAAARPGLDVDAAPVPESDTVLVPSTPEVAQKEPLRSEAISAVKPASPSLAETIDTIKDRTSRTTEPRPRPEIKPVLAPQLEAEPELDQVAETEGIQVDDPPRGLADEDSTEAMTAARRAAASAFKALQNKTAAHFVALQASKAGSASKPEPEPEPDGGGSDWTTEEIRRRSPAGWPSTAFGQERLKMLFSELLEMWPDIEPQPGKLRETPERGAQYLAGVLAAQPFPKPPELFVWPKSKFARMALAASLAQQVARLAKQEPLQRLDFTGEPMRDHEHAAAAIAALHRVLKDETNSATSLERMLNDCQTALSFNRSATLNNCSGLTSPKGDTGKSIDTVAMLEELLADVGRVLGPDHPDVLKTRYLLAIMRGTAGDPAGAVAASKELLADAERVLGPDHPDVLNTRYLLAIMRGTAGDPAGAVAASKELLADAERVLGPDHPDTLIYRTNLALWRGGAGDRVDAVAVLEELLADVQRVLGPDHPDVLATREQLAHWRGGAGDVT